MMQKWLLTGICAVIGFTNANAQGGAYAERVQNYIERFRDLAIAEQIRSGVPAAITLAQGIHETGAGSSELATEANNHFGIKCKRDWKGMTFVHTDDRPNECFRKYNSSEESYKDHSDYLASQPRYASLFKLSATDYAAWAIGLRQAGYATNPRYAFVLIGLIEDYKLQEYTYAALNDGTYGNYAVKTEVVPENDPEPEITAIPAVAARTAATGTAPVASQTFTSSKNSRLVVSQTGNAEDPDLAKMPKPQYGQVVNVNGLKAVYAKKGDMPLEYAFRHSIRYAKLLEMNDLGDKPLPTDMYLYLEKKHSKGLHPMHMVKPGETMIQIAQAEGIQMKSLRSFNMMAPGDEPAPGTTLELQRMASSRPRLEGEAVAAVPPPAAKPVVRQEISKPAPAQPAVNNNSSSIKVATVPPKAVATPPAAVAATPVRKEPVATTAPATATTTKPVAGNTDYIEKSKVEEAATTPADDVPVSSSVRKRREDYIASTAPVATPVKTATAEYVNEEDRKQEASFSYANKVETVKEEPVEETSIPARPVVEEEEEKEVPVAAVEEPAPAIEETPVQEAPVKEIPAVAATTTTAKPAANVPGDELDALKAKFDMVVYSSEPKETPATPVAEEKDEAPKKVAAKKEETKPVVAASSEGSKFYTVKKGDTAFTIARNNNITVRQLMEWNNLDFEAIKVGQKLRVK